MLHGPKQKRVNGNLKVTIQDPDYNLESTDKKIPEQGISWNYIELEKKHKRLLPRNWKRN